MKADVKQLRGLSTALCLLSGAAFAQSGPQADTTAQTTEAAAPTSEQATPVADGGLQAVIVTATRRATSLQKVTATIDVVDASKLDQLNIKDAIGLETMVPGMTVSRSGGVMPFIRGIGTFSAGFTESSVGAYIDGIYLPNASGVLFSFNNIDRVEVLKGPQGTLYGRNTTGGLINVITRSPEQATTIDASVGFSSFDTKTENFYGSTSLSDSVAANIAVYHQKQGKGWTTNVTTGHDVQKSDDSGVYAKVQWKVDNNTKVTASALYNKDESNKGWAFAVMPGTYGLDGTPYLGEYKMSNRIDPQASYKGSMGSLKIEHAFGTLDFFSLTGIQYGNQFSELNQNGIPGNPVAGQGAANIDLGFTNHTLSQEFQLASKDSTSPFDWVAGAYFYKDVTDVLASPFATCIGNVCAPLPGNLPPTYSNTTSTTKSNSVYADGTYKLLPATRLTIGLRYTDDKKSFSGLITPRPGFPNSVTTLPANIIQTPAQAGLPAEVSFPKTTYRVVLAQDFTKDIQGYVSNNLGFKAGTYNPNGVTNQPVRPELLTSTEVGLKSELFERRVRLNLSAFHYKYTDIQVRSNAGLPVGSPSVGSNIASAHTNGLDAQIDWRPMRGLSLNAGFEYLDAKYDRYPGTTCVTPRVPGGAFLGGLIGVTCDLAGGRMPMSPKYSLVLGAAYSFNTSFGNVTALVNDSFKTEYSYDPDYSANQPTTQIVDASVKWKSSDDRFDVTLQIKNATNKYRYLSAQAASTFVYVPGEPRTFGIMLGYHL